MSILRLKIDEDVVAHVDNLLERLEHVGDLICEEKDMNFAENRKELSKSIHAEYKELKEQFKAEYKACKHYDIQDLSNTKKNYVWGIEEATIKGVIFFDNFCRKDIPRIS